MNETNSQGGPSFTIQDFESCGWEEIIRQVEPANNRTMCQAFSAASRLAETNNSALKSKLLGLLADACSMVLNPSSRNHPFKPVMVLSDRRSTAIDDISDADIDFFVSIVDAIEHPWLKARIADLIWVKQRRRGIHFANMAIDSYRALALSPAAFNQGNGLCWERALVFSLQLGSGAGERLNEMKLQLMNEFMAITVDDLFHGIRLSNLLKLLKRQLENKQDIAHKLEGLAEEFLARNAFHAMREYYSAAADWYQYNGDDPRRWSMITALAEGWVKEAESRIAGTNSGHMIAASFYENAIQVFRTIPGRYREANNVEQRMREIRSLLSSAGERALSEMSAISSPAVDISQLVAEAKIQVSGKEPSEALLYFTNLHNGANVEELREGVISRMQNYPFQALITSTLMSSDGRVIARRPGISLNGDNVQGDDETIRAEMVRDYEMLIKIIVEARIIPALDVLLIEHPFCESDFIELAYKSPIVPKDRAVLFGKALYAGYERDFITALHLLTPQLEHMVRTHLKAAGAITTNLDNNGIENEYGLSTLVELPEIARIFGQHITFELKSLFCDSFGPNLRNEVAHGLLDVHRFNSPDIIYAWWFALKLIFNTWWNMAAANYASSDESNEDEVV